MDDGDYQLLVCALQQNFAEAGEVVADGAGWLLQFVNNAVQCTPLFQCTPLHHIRPHHIRPHHITPHHITPHHTTTHCTTPYHTTLQHTAPHHTTPHQTTLHYSTAHCSTYGCIIFSGVSDDVFVSLSMVDNVDMHNTSLGEETDEGVKGDVKGIENIQTECHDITLSQILLLCAHSVAQSSRRPPSPLRSWVLAFSSRVLNI